MRLIDADAVTSEIEENKLMAREPAAKRCVEIIKNLSTAYDVDKVVEKLEQKALEHAINANQYGEDGWDNHAQHEKEASDCYNDAIEIVKKGGIE